MTRLTSEVNVLRCFSSLNNVAIQWVSLIPHLVFLSLQSDAGSLLETASLRMVLCVFLMMIAVMRGDFLGNCMERLKRFFRGIRTGKRCINKKRKLSSINLLFRSVQK